ncbi:hypothetical protein NLI96_g12380 [Meripilus lineatus]|uniref:Uncharacterized protein n=1 Tax=Meripilus lineatus TaxID=2056292 RepID=A0AAD5Y9Y0_9APHY|nr:hypothetical protein NLI96_g12380 [Physisporinus lineatus]
MVACYQDTLDVVARVCCAHYDEVTSNDSKSEHRQEQESRLNNAYYTLKELEQHLSETTDPSDMDVISLIPGRLKFKGLTEKRLTESLKRLDGKMTECLDPLIEEMTQWYKQCLKESQEGIHENRPTEGVDKTNEEKAERLKHLIGYLGLLAKEEDIGFQLDDERAQDLVDLAYEASRFYDLGPPSLFKEQLDPSSPKAST